MLVLHVHCDPVDAMGANLINQVCEALKPRIERLKVGPATDKASEMGPVITRASMDRINALVQSGIAQGATLTVRPV